MLPTVTGSRRADLWLLAALAAAILLAAPRLVVYERVPRWAIRRAAEAERGGETPSERPVRGRTGSQP